VPFQLDINKSSPSARPYEHASEAAKCISDMLHVHMQSLAYQLLDPFLLSRALPVAGSFEGLWHPCYRIAGRGEIIVCCRSCTGQARESESYLLDLLTRFAERVNEEVVQASLGDC
jgi:hypothetical protein